MVLARIVDAAAAQDSLRRRRATARSLLWLIAAVAAVALYEQPWTFPMWISICGCLLQAGQWSRDYAAWSEGFRDGWKLAQEAQKGQRR